MMILVMLATFLCMPYAIALHERGLEYQKNEQFVEAIACYEELLQASPGNAQLQFSLGCCYLAVGEGDKAIAAFTDVITNYPDAVSARYNLAYTHKTFGNLDMAIEIYKRLVEENPEYEQAHLGLGFAYITQGDFEHGWQQHERYLKQSGKNGDALRELLCNDDVCYKKILLRPEGGLGDTLHFVRYAQRLKEMGADIIVTCQKQLIPLLSRCYYIDQLLPCGAQLPLYDADATLMSLPAIFADDEQSAPKNIPYLCADPELVAYWRKRLAADTNFKVGICWQVDAYNDTSKLPVARRGVPLESFVKLHDIAHVSFYSLQKYDGTEQLAELSSDFKLRTFDNLDEQSGPFMDTAALIKNLDLVITVDTAVAHLAGALGCTVWLVHPYATADWRWICHRTNSYWYPAMRIFKQHKPFDYDGVMEQVHDALRELLAK